MRTKARGGAATQGGGWQARAPYLGELGGPREVVAVAAGVSLREGKGNGSKSNNDESEPRALRNRCIMQRSRLRQDEGRAHRVVARPRGLPRVRALQGRGVLRRPPHELLDQAAPRRGSGFQHVLGNVLQVDSEFTFSPYHKLSWSYSAMWNRMQAAAPPPPPPLVLSGHAASLTPY